MEKSEEKIPDFLARIGMVAILILLVGVVVVFFYFKTPITPDFLPLAVLWLSILAIDLLISQGIQMEESDEKVTKFFAWIGAIAIIILILGTAAAFFYFKTPVTADFLPLTVLVLFVWAVDLMISPGVFFVGIINSALNLQMTEAQIFNWAVPTCIVVLFILASIVESLNQAKKITNEELNLKKFKAYGIVILLSIISAAAINNFFATHIQASVFKKYLKLEENYPLIPKEKN